MKKVLTISSVLLGVVFLAGCGQQPVSQTQPITPAPVEQTPVVNQPVATQPNASSIVVPADWKVYQNTKYKYAFRYPTNFNLSAKADSQDASIISKEDSNLIVNLTAGGVASVDDGTGKCPQGKIAKSLIVDSQNIEICQGDNKRFDFYTLIPRDPKNTADDIFVEVIGSANKQQQTQTFFEQLVSSFKFTK